MLHICVCERHKHSDRALVPLLNSTKASPASTASPPLKGETKKKKREKRKRPICSTKREEKKHLRLLCLVFYSLFLIVRRGKHRGGRMIMREHGKKLPKTEKESNGRCCGCKSSENNTVTTGCQYDLFVKPILPLSRADTLLPRGSTHIQHSDT